MKYSRRDRFFAITLLMVMFMQMGIRIVHLHHHAESVLTECSDCQHNRVHSGHIVSWDGTQDDCLICQYLATPFLKAEGAKCHVYATEHHQPLCSCVSDISDRSCQCLRPRGPPSVS